MHHGKAHYWWALLFYEAKVFLAWKSRRKASITSYINRMEFIKDTFKVWRKTYGNIINFSP